MALQIGRLGQVYLKKEAAYGVEEALAAANAMRHLNVGSFAWDPFARVTSQEKQQSPGPVVRFDRKQNAGLTGLVSLLRPSGVLNTVPEIDPILECAFGSKTNVTLATTVASGPTTTGCTVASAGALAIGDAVQLEVTGQSGLFIRFLTNVAGNVLTWAPALPGAQTVGDDVKGCITWKLTNGLQLSLTLLHSLAAFKREIVGWGVDSLALSFAENAEPQATAGGPGAEVRTGTAQAKPGSFTSVGGNPPSGLVGETLIDGTAYLMKSLEIAITNGLKVRNMEYGVNKPTEVFRSGRREITLSLDAFAETEATLYDKTESGANVSVFNQTGRTNGNIVAVYAPRVEFKPPETDDPDEETSWSFGSGLALATADGLNDELRLAFA